MTYYGNLTENDIRSVINPDEVFSDYEFRSERGDKDLYFYGIKRS
jgi:hypothetical protein